MLAIEIIFGYTIALVCLMLFLRGVGMVNRREVEQEERESFDRLFEYDQLRRESEWKR